MCAQILIKLYLELGSRQAKSKESIEKQAGICSFGENLIY